MYAESIGAIGSQNPAIAAFLGQSFHTAEQLGLNATYPAFVSITSDTMKALTSPFPVVDVSPVIRSNVFGRDTERLDGVDGAQHLHDLRPAMQVQQDLAARIDMRQR